MATYSVALLFAWVALAREIVEAAGSRLRWNCARVWVGGVLSCAGGVRAALGEYRAGAFVGIVAGREFSVHGDRTIRSTRLFNWIASTTAIVLIVVTGIAAIAARCRVGSTDGAEPAPTATAMQPGSESTESGDETAVLD